MVLYIDSLLMYILIVYLLDGSIYQGCKLLSDIGQCPTKFGKCPSKSNFDRTLVRSKKYTVTLYIF